MRRDRLFKRLMRHERRVEELLKSAEDGQTQALDIPLADLFVDEEEPPAKPAIAPPV